MIDSYTDIKLCSYLCSQKIIRLFQCITQLKGRRKVQCLIQELTRLVLGTYGLAPDA